MEEVVEKKEKVDEKPEEIAVPAAKSWASLFHNEAPPRVTNTTKPTAMIQPYSSSKEANASGGASSCKDASRSIKLAATGRDVGLAKILQAYVLNHKSPSIKPRGLSNRSNWCFVNAILQALVACPPFFNLIKALPEATKQAANEDEDPSSSPIKILKAVHMFVSEFSPLDSFPKLNRRDKSKKNGDLPVGKTFEASSIFQLLLNLNDDTFKVIESRQEDAEEFLTFLLNGLNDEMLALLKVLDDDNDDDNDEAKENGLVNDDTNEEGEWHEVGARNRSCVTRRVGSISSHSLIRTPLANTFQGQTQSCVQHSNSEPTATLQPFFTLQLDIQSDGVKNVADALRHNFSVEALHDYMCPKTKKEIEASRSLLLEELPAVLVLHLKRFVYDENSSAGCQKLLKNIDFPVDLEIARDILSLNGKNKYHPKQRNYKLFAVVYHNGQGASLGHYVTDVYHSGLGWLHCDDSQIKSVTEAMVLAHSATSVPYILFYRRGDTMVGLEQRATPAAAKN